MESELGYYISHFLRMGFPLVPIGLMLVLARFLRQKQKTRLTFWLQTTSVAWLIIAMGNRFLLAWTMGVIKLGDRDGINRLLVWERVSDLTWIVETMVFIAFAILLLIYFRRGADAFETTRHYSAN